VLQQLRPFVELCCVLLPVSVILVCVRWINVFHSGGGHLSPARKLQFFQKKFKAEIVSAGAERQQLSLSLASFWNEKVRPWGDFYSEHTHTQPEIYSKLKANWRPIFLCFGFDIAAESAHRCCCCCW
jgi:hypothetical protein